MQLSLQFISLFQAHHLIPLLSEKMLFILSLKQDSEGQMTAHALFTQIIAFFLTFVIIFNANYSFGLYYFWTKQWEIIGQDFISFEH